MSNTESKEATKTFVLIAGAWHGAWCWERVIPLLTAAGHRVLAPDLLGMGEDPTPLADVTLASWADEIARLVEQEADPVILVGHSRGGPVISEVAERVPDRIATLVWPSDREAVQIGHMTAEPTLSVTCAEPCPDLTAVF